MKTLIIHLESNLFGETEVHILHASLAHPMIVAYSDLDTTLRELERQLVIESKSVLKKYITVFKKSKGFYATPEENKAFESIKEFLPYLSRRMRLKTVQNAILLKLSMIKTLLPSSKSRFLPSQTAKIDFLEAMAAFDLDSAKKLIYRNIKMTL